MLRSLLPKAHPKFLAMPVLGPIVDGFDDWLSARGYTGGSRELSIRILPRVDAELRRHQINDVAKLTHPVLHDCWTLLMKTRPEHAGAVRCLERYLLAQGLIADDEQATTPPPVSILSEEYANYLREVCGFATSTISFHRHTADCFLRHLEEEGATLPCIQISHIESYIAKDRQTPEPGKSSTRYRGAERISSIPDHRWQSFRRTDRQIDTPRLYRLEQLPRALPWEMVRTLLQSIDTASAMGLRDYAMFLLIATYGLRGSEVDAHTLDDIRWRAAQFTNPTAQDLLVLGTAPDQRSC